MADEPENLREMTVEGKPLKRNLPSLSRLEIAGLIFKHHGNLYAISQASGRPYSTIHKRINSDVELLTLVAQQREIIVDMAEGVTIKNMKDGNQAAANRVLDTWGKDRGWGRQVVEHVGKDGGPIQQDTNVTAAVSEVDAPITKEEFEAARRAFVTKRD